MTNTTIERIKILIIDRPCNQSIVAPDSSDTITVLSLPALNPNVVMQTAILKRLKVNCPYKPKNMLRMKKGGDEQISSQKIQEEVR